MNTTPQQTDQQEGQKIVAGYRVPAEFKGRVKRTAKRLDKNAGDFVVEGMTLHMDRIDKKASRERGGSK